MPGLTAQQLKTALVNDPANVPASTVIQFDLVNGISPHGWEQATGASRMIGPMLPNVHRPMRFRSTHRDNFNVEYGDGQNGWAVGPNGTIRVAHHNIQGDDGLTENAQMLHSLGMYQNRFMRNDYRDFGDGYGSCSIIGVRGNNGWRIYAQVLSGGFGTYRIEQVNRLQ